MKLTIVAPDYCVGIDGEFFAPFDLTQLDAAIHAVQWNGDYGEIEYKSRFENGVVVRPINVLISDVAPYQFAIDAWNAAKQDSIAAEAATVAAAETVAQLNQQQTPVQNDEV